MERIENRYLQPVALGAVLLLPLFLFYGRAVADALICATDLLFLLRCGLARDWGWTRKPWVWAAGGIWALQLGASLANGPTHSVLEALVMIRLPLFVAAVSDWVLIRARDRTFMWSVFFALAVWTALQCWAQFWSGSNFTGSPRWGDGSLTGPFHKPRAGEIFLLLALPGLLPLVLFLLRGTRSRVGLGILVLLATLTTMILIGQRMPNLLFLFGLVLTALVEKKFRLPLILAFFTGILALMALPVISPPTWNKLVIHFLQQMSHFWVSPYGQLYTRASVMIAAHPWLGYGFEGFRDYCGRPAYLGGWPGLGIPGVVPGASGCNLHPHNYYLQVATMAGLPGLLLFLVLVGLWVARISRALAPARDGIQAMLFVTVCVMFWPLQSSSALFTLDTAGWVFLITGWALAASSRAPRL